MFDAFISLQQIEYGPGCSKSLRDSALEDQIWPHPALAATRPWGKSLLEQKSSENGHPNLNPEDPEPAEKTGGC